MFDFAELEIPLVGAPMAGGPSTPQLAAAVSNAGGLGMLAAGYLDASQLAEQVKQTRELTNRPFGVNLLVPTPADQIPVDAAEQLERFRQDLAFLEKPLRVKIPAVVPDTEADQANFEELLGVVLEAKPACVTFTFGCPSASVINDLKRAGCLTGVTVTCVSDGVTAVHAGADFLCVQGPGAGGHQSTFRVADEPNKIPLAQLLKSLRYVTDVPLIAAGGVRTAAQVKELLSEGAVAVQIGTPLLLADEAGTNEAHRNLLLAEPRPTVLTLSFTGRYARAITNAWTVTFPNGPAIYPGLHQLTSTARKAAAGLGDFEWVHAWAGENYSTVHPDSAAEILNRFIE